MSPDSGLCEGESWPLISLGDLPPPQTVELHAPSRELVFPLFSGRRKWGVAMLTLVGAGGAPHASVARPERWLAEQERLAALAEQPPTPDITFRLSDAGVLEGTSAAVHDAFFGRECGGPVLPNT